MTKIPQNDQKLIKNPPKSIHFEQKLLKNIKFDAFYVYFTFNPYAFKKTPLKQEPAKKVPFRAEDIKNFNFFLFFHDKFFYKKLNANRRYFRINFISKK